MSSLDSSHRSHHYGLLTEQRRLRHLNSLSARNLVPTPAQRQRDTLMETYFTLHVWPSRDIIYTGERIHNSLNPTWRSFDLQMSCPNLDASQSTILVCIWGGYDTECSMVLEWLLDLRGLCYLGSQIHKDGVRYQPNSVIFGMFHGFYGAPDNLPDAAAISKQFQTSIDIEQSNAILSYKTFSLGRLHTTQRAIRQTEVTVANVRSFIEEKLTLAKNKTILCSQREALKLRVGVLKRELELKETFLAEDCKRCTQLRQVIDTKAQDLKMRQEQRKTGEEEANYQRQILKEKSEHLQKVSSRYQARKTTLIGELSDIYPVVESQNKEYTILGIKLPNAESYAGTEDMVVSTGLGHTCHLVLMISEILKLPLRYPMIHYGSRSLVRDHITESLADKDRDFPLYSRGKERFQFNYALYLMNRNIAQLRYAMNLPTTDLRATLPNLKSLLELKWGIKNKPANVIYQTPTQSLLVTTQQVSHHQRIPPVSTAMLSARYPLQVPPAYTVDTGLGEPQKQQQQFNTPPPPYLQSQKNVSSREPNSPFELLPSEPPLTSPIPIPSVDTAAKSIKAKQLIRNSTNHDRTFADLTLVATSIEESDLGNPSSIVSSKQPNPGFPLTGQDSWQSADGGGSCGHVDVGQVNNSEIDGPSSSERLHQSPDGERMLENLRSNVLVSGEGRDSVLPYPGPFGQLEESGQLDLAQTSSLIKSDQESGSHANSNHHNMPDVSSLLEETFHTPPSWIPPRKLPESPPSHSQIAPDIVKKRSKLVPVVQFAEPEPGFQFENSKEIDSTYVVHDSHRAFVLSPEESSCQEDVQDLNTFQDLDNRTLLLASKQDSFSSYRKSSDLTKRNKSGNV